MGSPTDREKPGGRAKGVSPAGKKATLHGPDLTWRLLAENIPNIVILTSPDGTIQFINHTISGWSVEDVLGKSIYDFVEEEFHNTIRQTIQQVLKTDDPGTCQVQMTVPEGEPRWYETHIGPTKYGGKTTGLAMISTDITEHRLTDEKMRHSEERYRAIFEQSADGILLIDTDGRWSDFNTAAHENVGYTRDEFKDLRIADVEVIESQEQIKATIAKITGEGRGTFETKHRTKQGEIRDVVVTARTITVSGELIFVSVWRDITERKKAEDEIHSLARFPGENPNPVLRISKDIRIIYANEASGPLLSLWQCRVGQHLPEPCAARAREAFQSGKPSEFEFDCIDRVFSVTLAPVPETGYLNAYAHDITERKRAEEALRQSQEALQAKNVALREVLADIQEEKNEMARQIMDNVDKIITPMLHDLQRDLPPRQHKRIAVLEESLKEITSPLAARLSKGIVRLTPIELRICNLIRSGMSTKDISELQHISAATVSKHRENIRRKLGIAGRNVNLASHLESLLSKNSRK